MAKKQSNAGAGDSPLPSVSESKVRQALQDLIQAAEEARNQLHVCSCALLSDHAQCEADVSRLIDYTISPDLGEAIVRADKVLRNAGEVSHG